MNLICIEYAQLQHFYHFNFKIYEIVEFSIFQVFECILGFSSNMILRLYLLNIAVYARLENDYGLDTFQNEVCTWIPE